MLRINLQTRIAGPDGRPTVEFVRYMQEIERKIAAIGAVTKPTGGATQDAEARTAIDAIIDGAS